MPVRITTLCRDNIRLMSCNSVARPTKLFDSAKCSADRRPPAASSRGCEMVLGAGSDPMPHTVPHLPQHTATGGSAVSVARGFTQASDCGTVCRPAAPGHAAIANASTPASHSAMRRSWSGTLTRAALRPLPQKPGPSRRVIDPPGPSGTKARQEPYGPHQSALPPKRSVTNSPRSTNPLVCASRSTKTAVGTAAAHSSLPSGAPAPISHRYILVVLTMASRDPAR